MIYTTAKTYYKTVAQEHYLVRHERANSEEDATLRNSFVDNDNDEGLSANVINNGHFPMVVHAGFSGKPIDKNGSIRVKVNSVLWFLSHKTGSTALEAKHSAMEESFGVMMDYLSRMNNDFEENGSCGPFKDFDLNLCNWRELPDLSDGLCGWELMITHEVAASALLDYNEENWLTPLND
jgi:hypothetical protein